MKNRKYLIVFMVGILMNTLIISYRHGEVKVDFDVILYPLTIGGYLLLSTIIMTLLFGNYIKSRLLFVLTILILPFMIITVIDVSKEAIRVHNLKSFYNSIKEDYRADISIDYYGKGMTLSGNCFVLDHDYLISSEICNNTSLNADPSLYKVSVYKKNKGKIYEKKISEIVANIGIQTNYSFEYLNLIYPLHPNEEGTMRIHVSSDEIKGHHMYYIGASDEGFTYTLFDPDKKIFSENSEDK